MKPVVNCLAVVLSVVVLGCADRATEQLAPPNIILVMADDMEWGQTGYYNHPVLKTPNLDAMAARGATVRPLLCRYPELLADSRQCHERALERSDRR
jgi:hypothetical protein